MIKDVQNVNWLIKNFKNMLKNIKTVILSQEIPYFQIHINVEYQIWFGSRYFEEFNCCKHIYKPILNEIDLLEELLKNTILNLKKINALEQFILGEITYKKALKKL